MIDPSFIEHMKSLIGVHFFEHFYLVRNVLSANHRNVEPNKVWVIGEESNWILGFCAEGQYHIYGDNWIESQLEKFIENIDFNGIPDNFQFTGNRELIEFLISKNEQIEFNLFKNRVFYEASNTSEIEELNNVEMRVCELKDLHEVTKMNCDFFVEEYNGENNKDFEELKADMEKHIVDEKFYIAENDKGILAFCSILDTEFDNPMIGTIYVKSEHRNQGVGQFLLKKVSDLVLFEYPKCWLITDEKNESSNVLVKKIGYEAIYDYTSGTIKKL